MMRRTIAAMLSVVVLLAGCSSSIEDRAEELFRACIEEGGGTTGDLTPMVEGSQLIVMSGPVDAAGDLVERCFDATNAGLSAPD